MLLGASQYILRIESTNYWERQGWLRGLKIEEWLENPYKSVITPPGPIQCFWDPIPLKEKWFLKQLNQRVSDSRAPGREGDENKMSYSNREIEWNSTRWTVRQESFHLPARQYHRQDLYPGRVLGHPSKKFASILFSDLTFRVQLQSCLGFARVCVCTHTWATNQLFYRLTPKYELSAKNH